MSDRQNSARHLTCNSGLLYIRGTDREKLRDCYVTVRIGLGPWNGKKLKAVWKRDPRR